MASFPSYLNKNEESIYPIPSILFVHQSLLFLFFELFYMFICPCLNGLCYHTPPAQRTRQLDCGIHPGQSGISGLPFFDEVDPATIDVLLITQ